MVEGWKSKTADPPPLCSFTRPSAGNSSLAAAEPWFAEVRRSSSARRISATGRSTTLQSTLHALSCLRCRIPSMHRNVCVVENIARRSACLCPPKCTMYPLDSLFHSENNAIIHGKRRPQNYRLTSNPKNMEPWESQNRNPSGTLL